MTWLSGIGAICLAVVIIKTTGASSLPRQYTKGPSPDSYGPPPSYQSQQGFAPQPSQVRSGPPPSYQSQQGFAPQPSQVRSEPPPSYQSQQGFAPQHSQVRSLPAYPQTYQQGGYENPQYQEHRSSYQEHEDPYDQNRFRTNFPDPSAQVVPPFAKPPTDSPLGRVLCALAVTLGNSDLTQNPIANYLIQGISTNTREFLVFVLEKLKAVIAGPSQYGNGGMGNLNENQGQTMSYNNGYGGAPNTNKGQLGSGYNANYNTGADLQAALQASRNQIGSSNGLQTNGQTYGNGLQNGALYARIPQRGY